MEHLHHRVPVYVPVVLITIGVFLALTSFINDSQIVDEIPHVGAGYSYLVKQDMRLNPEHPPLVKDLSAVPLLFMHIEQTVFQSMHWTTAVNSQWEFGRQFIYNTGNNADKIKFLSRIPMLLFYILSAALLFKWGRELYGDKGAVIALVLFLFSPTVIAHTRFVTTDVPALFGTLITIYFFLQFLQKKTKAHLIGAGVALGIALLLKFSTFLLLPFLLVVGLGYAFLLDNHRHHTWRHLGRMFLATAGIFTVAFIVVWIVYAFHTLNYPAERQLSDTKALLSSFGNRFLADIVIWSADKPVLRALGQYFLGFLMVVQRSAGGNTIFFLGEVKNQGGPLYFPLVYFLKEPLAWWILAALAGSSVLYRVSSARHSVQRSFQWLRRHFPEMVMVGWLAFYWYISIRSTLNIGVRHILPTFPFAILLVSGQIAYLADWIHQHYRKMYKAFTIGVAIIRIYPLYLSYFNQAAGGPAGGHKYVTDSNLDWGQDLKRLGQFVDEQKIQRIEVDYFGWADQRAYLGGKFIWLTANKYTSARDFINRNTTNGWLAVSATFLKQAQSPSSDNPLKKLDYTWLKNYEPVAVIGNSIFVWRITK
jgi:hypothetical protein